MGRGVYALQGTALRRHRRARDRGRRPDAAPSRCRAATTGRTRPPPTPPPARWASPTADAAEGLDDLPGPRPPHGDHRRHRQGALRQRLQGHQRRRRPPGAVQLSDGSTGSPAASPRPAASTASPTSSARIAKAYLIGEAEDAFAAHAGGPRPLRPGRHAWTRPCAPPSPTPARRRRGRHRAASRRPAPRSTSSPISRSAAKPSAPPSRPCIAPSKQALAG